MDDIKRILVVNRMTKCCRKALEYGISLSKKYGSEIFVMHVFHNPFGLEGWNIPMISLKEDYRKELEKTKKEFDQFIKKVNKAGMNIRELVPEGEPIAEIFKTIKNERIDLLIMSMHEEGRLEHALFGRSNDEIIRRMPCSIFLVKQHLRTVWY